MFKTFQSDRTFIEEKYHKKNEPFDPYNRMAYHGWEGLPESGLSVEDIKNGLIDISKKIRRKITRDSEVESNRICA